MKFNPVMCFILTVSFLCFGLIESKAADIDIYQYSMDSPEYAVSQFLVLMKNGQWHEAEKFCTKEYLESKYHKKFKVICTSIEFPKNSTLRSIGKGNERMVQLESYAIFQKTGERDDINGRFLVNKINNKWLITGHY